MTKWDIIKRNYIDKGIKIFPIKQNDKTPMIPAWQKECSSDFFQVLYWFENCKGCNFGLPANENGLFILDLDVHDEDKNGVENFNKLINNISDFPIEISFYDYCNTLIQKTPSGGIHIIFKTDNELMNVINSANVFKDYPGIDIRTQGYIVVEPSTINDNKYEFINTNGISEMPEELKKFILENVNLKNDSKKTPYKKPTTVEVGDRDNQLFSYINNIYYKTRLDFDEIMALANNFNENILDKPLPERVVKYKVRKIFEKDRNKCIYVWLNDE